MVDAKLRSVSRPMPAELTVKADGTAFLTLAAPQYGIAPGQAAVCYLGSRVIGGGWISGTENSQIQLAA